MTTHIIALSGGKDSTALALALQLFEPRDYVVIANPTGNELPEMEQHLRNVEARLGLPVQRVGCGLSFDELIYKERMIPNHWARFCTRYYPSYWRQGERIERDIGHTFRGNGDTWPAAMRDLRKSFERGHVPRKAPNRKKLTEMCPVCAM